MHKFGGGTGCAQMSGQGRIKRGHPSDGLSRLHFHAECLLNGRVPPEPHSPDFQHVRVSMQKATKQGLIEGATHSRARMLEMLTSTTRHWKAAVGLPGCEEVINAGDCASLSRPTPSGSAAGH